MLPKSWRTFLKSASTGGSSVTSTGYSLTLPRRQSRTVSLSFSLLVIEVDQRKVSALTGQHPRLLPA